MHNYLPLNDFVSKVLSSIQQGYDEGETKPLAYPKVHVDLLVAFNHENNIYVRAVDSHSGGSSSNGVVADYSRIKFTIHKNLEKD